MKILQVASLQASFKQNDLQISPAGLEETCGQHIESLYFYKNTVRKFVTASKE